MAPLHAAGVAVSPILRVGDPGDIIVEVATNLKADLVILGSHSKRGLLDIGLGWTAQHVSKAAPCLVVLVSPQPEGKQSRAAWITLRSISQFLAVCRRSKGVSMQTPPTRCGSSSLLVNWGHSIYYILWRIKSGGDAVYLSSPWQGASPARASLFEAFSAHGHHLHPSKAARN